MKLAYIENIRLPTERAHGYQVMKTCEALARAGVSVELVTAARRHALHGKDPFAHYGMTRNFSWRELPVMDVMPWAKGPLLRFAYWFERWTFLQHLKKSLPDADAFYTRDIAVAEKLVRLTSKPIFVELHDDPRSNRDRWNGLKNKIAGWIVISTELKKVLEQGGVDEKRVMISYDAYDEQEFASLKSKAEARQELGMDPNKFLVVYLGQLFPWKGVDSIAPAFSFIPEGMELAIVGGYQEDIDRIKKIMGDAPHVRFTGQLSRDKAREWLAAADAALLSTSAKFAIGKQFTSPLKLFEYLAAKLPIIASAVPSSKEILTDHQAVEYFAPDDSQDFLRAAKMMSTKSHMELQAMSDHAYELGKKYTWTARGKGIADFLRRSL